MGDKFSHLDKNGQAAMVDVSAKTVSHRNATARSIVYLPAEVLQQLIDGDIQTKKGSIIKELNAENTIALIIGLILSVIC